MEPRIYHGNITPESIGSALLAKFNRGNLRATQYGDEELVIIQIATREYVSSGGSMAMTVTLKNVEDGVAVQVGKGSMLGTIASLGLTTLATLRNPLNLLGRLDDLAQDIENLQTEENVWGVIDEVMRTAGASYELSERLRRMVCSYCNTPNPVGESSCIACGAPLGDVQPETCENCGFVLKHGETRCPNCGQPVIRAGTEQHL
jgi:hypothetical protein